MYVVPFEEIYGIAQYDKVMPEKEKVDENPGTFAELNLGFDKDQAAIEAARCLHCGHCKTCGSCVDDCPGYILVMAQLKNSERPEVRFGNECWHCANCRTSCPTGAIAFTFPLRMQV